MHTVYTHDTHVLIGTYSSPQSVERIAPCVRKRPISGQKLNSYQRESQQYGNI